MKTVRAIGLAQKLEFLMISTNSCTDNRMRATAKQCPKPRRVQLARDTDPLDRENAGK